jgi:hypothetical protein
MHLVLDCPDHGKHEEKVESDAGFFAKGYEAEYKERVRQLLIPVTYRCNQACDYCYALSNLPGHQPPDRSLENILETVRNFDGNVSFMGGEPTVRADLFELIEAAKQTRNNLRLDIGTNGRKLADPAYTAGLKEAGLDFVFFSYNDAAYEHSAEAVRIKAAALDNCAINRLPVILQRTVSSLRQVDSLWPALEKYRGNVIGVYLRTVQPYAEKDIPENVFVSDIIKDLGKENEYKMGATPFNRTIRMFGRTVKISSGVADVRRLDDIDYKYQVADGRIFAFRRAVHVDTALLRRYAKTGSI